MDAKAPAYCSLRKNGSIQVRIKDGGKLISVGTFHTEAEAIAARDAALATRTTLPIGPKVRYPDRKPRTRRIERPKPAPREATVASAARLQMIKDVWKRMN